MEPLDFLAVGDIVSEPFIRLSDAEIYDKDGQSMLGMRFGDKIPYEESIHMPAVGNASNAAVAAARLGLSSALRAYVGDDAQGAECLARLEEEGVQTDYMVTERGKKTNHHYVLWYKDERTILVKHEDYDYEVPVLSHQPKWLYLSSLAKNSLPYHLALTDLLKAHSDIKLAFQPGTFQMALGTEALKELYARTEFFCVNVEEAARILNIPLSATLEARHPEDIKKLIQGLASLGPKLIVLTDGTEGAYAFDGSKYMRVPMYPDARKAFERTGAGDAFASSVVAAMAIGEPFEKALLWGPINSMSVVQDVGAQRGLLTREALLKYHSEAPESYALTEY